MTEEKRMRLEWWSSLSHWSTSISSTLSAFVYDVPCPGSCIWSFATSTSISPSIRTGWSAAVARVRLAEASPLDGDSRGSCHLSKFFLWQIIWDRFALDFALLFRWLSLLILCRVGQSAETCPSLLQNMHGREGHWSMLWLRPLQFEQWRRNVRRRGLWSGLFSTVKVSGSGTGASSVLRSLGVVWIASVIRFRGSGTTFGVVSWLLGIIRGINSSRS